MKWMGNRYEIIIYMFIFIEPMGFVEFSFIKWHIFGILKILKAHN